VASDRSRSAICDRPVTSSAPVARDDETDQMRSSYDSAREATSSVSSRDDDSTAAFAFECLRSSLSRRS
jgi:hypothetical protein